MLPLEMPELLPGMRLEPPADPGGLNSHGNGYLTAREFMDWASTVLREIGQRCQRPGEYSIAVAAMLLGLIRAPSPGPTPPPSGPVPATGIIAASELERRIRQEWPRETHTVILDQVGRPPQHIPLHFGVLADALRTVMALLVLAGEVEADEEADTFRRVYPLCRQIEPADVAQILEEHLRERYGRAIRRVRLETAMRGNRGHTHETLHVEHDDSVPEEELSVLLPHYCAFDHFHDLKPGTEPVTVPNPGMWMAALWPDGRAERLRRWTLGGSGRRLRYDDLPAGAELVMFQIDQAISEIVPKCGENCSAT